MLLTDSELANALAYGEEGFNHSVVANNYVNMSNHHMLQFPIISGFYQNTRPSSITAGVMDYLENNRIYYGPDGFGGFQSFGGAELIENYNYNVRMLFPRYINESYAFAKTIPANRALGFRFMPDSDMHIINITDSIVLSHLCRIDGRFGRDSSDWLDKVTELDVLVNRLNSAGVQELINEINRQYEKWLN
jgi:hypothetical protein